MVLSSGARDASGRRSFRLGLPEKVGMHGALLNGRGEVEAFLVRRGMWAKAERQGEHTLSSLRVKDGSNMSSVRLCFYLVCIPPLCIFMFTENNRYLNLKYHISICSNFQMVAQNYLEKSEIRKSIHGYIKECFPHPRERWSL